jgi:hypothetical protein
MRKDSTNDMDGEEGEECSMCVVVAATVTVTVTVTFPENKTEKGYGRGR